MTSLECGIVILPPTELAERVAACQRAVDGAFVPSYPPHVTLKALFQCKTSDAAIAEAIESVCRSHRPVRIIFEGLESFSSTNGNILHLAVRPTAGLRSLHTRLLHALTPLTTPSESVVPGYEGAAYTPHLTVFSGVPDALMEAARQSAVCLSPAKGFLATEVALICRQAREPEARGSGWQPPHIFALGRRNAPTRNATGRICNTPSGEAR